MELAGAPNTSFKLVMGSPKVAYLLQNQKLVVQVSAVQAAKVGQTHQTVLARVLEELCLITEIAVDEHPGIPILKPTAVEIRDKLLAQGRA